MLSVTVTPKLPRSFMTRYVAYNVPIFSRHRAKNYQAQTLMHTSNLYHNPWTGALSKLLVSTTKATGGMHDATRAFICNSGTEANEAAIKFARKVGKELDPSEQKVEIVSFKGAFHGRTLGALSATPTPKY